MHFSKTHRLLLSLSVIAYCVGVLSAPYVKIGVERYLLGKTEVSLPKIASEDGDSI